MNKKLQYVIYIIVFILVIVGLNIGYELQVRKQNSNEFEFVNENTNKTAETKTRQAIDFTVYDKNNNPVALSDFKGKPIVINFWATWCGYCIMEMPDFEQVYQQEKENVTFLMVNATDGINETQEKASKYVEYENYTFPVYYDLKQEAITKYGISGFPTTIFIDKDFNIVTIYPSMLTKQKLIQYINKIK